MVVAVNNAALNALQQILISDIEINGELLNLTSSELKQVRISNAENRHESAVITTQLTKKDIDKYIGKAITFHYGPRFSGSTFYGYVITINPNQDYQQDTIVDISCFGTTWPLQSGKPRFFPPSRVHTVFAEVVKDHDLGCQADSHPYVWPALAQTSESDWEFLQTLATRVGFAVYVYNGLVRMVNPKRVLAQSDIYQRYIKSDDVLDPTRQLLDFNPTTQSLRIRDNIKPSFGYFDGEVPRLTQPRTESPYRMSTDTPVTDKNMADTYSEAWERRIDFWNQQAVARINGNAKIIPGVNVSVQVSGNPSGRNEYDGTWFVRAIEHSLTNNSFQTALVLARDTAIPSLNNTDYRGLFANSEQGTPKVRKAERGSPSDIYWESSWKGKPEYISDLLFEDNPITIQPILPTDLITPVLSDDLLPHNPPIVSG